MGKKVFKLSDFDSRACDIEIKVDGGLIRTLSLRKFTLLDRIWVEREFGSLFKWEKTLFPDTEGYSEAEWLECTLKTTHHLLEPECKEEFSDWEALANELECSVEVLVGLQKSLLYVLRGSEPVINKIDQAVKKNMEAMTRPKKRAKKKTKTGRK